MKLQFSEFALNTQLPFTLNRRDPQVPFPTHQHDFTELVIVHSGSGQHNTPAGSYNLGAGDVFIIAPGAEHSYTGLRNLRLSNLMYNENNLGLPLSRLRTVPGYHALFRLEPHFSSGQGGFGGRLRLSREELRSAERMLDRIEEEVRAQRPGYTFMALAILMELLGHVSRCYDSSRSASSQPLLRLGRAISHVESNFTGDIPLEFLARTAHMSVNTLLRSFRRVVGHSPIAYQQILRVQLAADMLARSEMNLTEIAFACGYNDSNYFSRQFRKHTGKSPREFRRSLPEVSSR